MSLSFVYTFLSIEALLIVALLAYTVYTTYLLRFFQTAPYVPSQPSVVQDMFLLAQLSPGMHVLELGSGNGEICIQAAERGAVALGMEANPALVTYARWRAKRHGVSTRARFERVDFWKSKFPTETDIVFMYLLPATMTRLYPKLCAELRPGTILISNAFTFSQIQPQATRGKAIKYALP